MARGGARALFVTVASGFRDEDAVTKKMSINSVNAERTIFILPVFQSLGEVSLSLTRNVYTCWYVKSAGGGVSCLRFLLWTRCCSCSFRRRIHGVTQAMVLSVVAGLKIEVSLVIDGLKIEVLPESEALPVVVELGQEVPLVEAFSPSVG